MRNRVNERVKKGGHSVPIKDIERRFSSSSKDLFNTIPKVDNGLILDNSTLAPVVIANIENGKIINANPKNKWIKEYLKNIKKF